MNDLPEAEFVVIGAGAIGCGVAYSLATAGRRDVLVVEREAEVASVTSAQGAGLCGQVRPELERTRLAMHSVATFRALQQDSEARPEWNEVGSLRLALSDAAVEEFRRLLAVCQEAGLEASLLSPEEAKRHWPAMEFRDVRTALWCPGDGYLSPQALCKAYEFQCRRLGVRFLTSAGVEEIVRARGRVAAVRTRRGEVRCRYVVNAAGAHAYHVARLAGLELPIVPVRHEYFVTVPLAGLHPGLPCFRVPELALYGRADGEGLLLGGWEAAARRADPREYGLQEIPPPVEPDWEVLNDFEQRFSRLLPNAVGAGKARVGRGWPTFTPDGRFIIGESSRVPGFVMAGGCNAHGISGSAGIGRLLVEALLEPTPSEYVRSLSPDRFTDRAWNWPEAGRQAQRVYETYYGPGC